MPVEIRELVIQAQVNDQQSIHDNGEQMQVKQENTIGFDELEEMMHHHIRNANNEMATFLMKEMKIWVKEYLEQHKRRF